MLKPMKRYTAGNIPPVRTADCFVTVNGERIKANRKERFSNQQQRARTMLGAFFNSPKNNFALA